MKPGNGIETRHCEVLADVLQTFKLMKPGNGIETILRESCGRDRGIFQINETRKRD